jgi:O-antigen biosynthesis protein
MIKNDWYKDYPPIQDITTATLDENSSLKKMLRLVDENKRVIDFGCATGYFAKLLQEKGCQVTGVEINPKAAQVAEQYCEKVIVADLDFTRLEEILHGQTFDVATLGDVLEHLRDPQRLLDQVAAILNPDGYIVASIPNIAHGAIRLALLQGKFEYTKYGILDNTHLRFFTYESAKALFDKTGYLINSVDRVVLPVFCESELIPNLKRADFSAEIIQDITKSEEAETLQFVMKCFPLTLEGKFSALTERYSTLENAFKHLKIKQEEDARIHEEEVSTQKQNSEQLYEKLQATLQERQIEQSQFQSTIVDLTTNLENLKEQFQVQLEQAHLTIERKEARIKERDQTVKARNQELKDLRERIGAMETSKFWKLRASWFRLKKFMKLLPDE